MAVGVTAFKVSGENGEQMHGLHFERATISGVFLVVVKTSATIPKFRHYPVSKLDYIDTDS